MGLKNKIIVCALFVSLVACNLASGQVDTPSPRFRPKALESADATRPLASPGIFDYDTRAFAPLEFTNGKQLEPSSGFYFTLDRTYTSVSRAGQIGIDTNSIQTGSEYIWGTRYNLGWFSDDDDGWGITYQNSRGSYFTNGQDVQVSQPMLVNMSFNTVEVNRLFRQSLSQGGYLEPYMGIRFVNISDRTIEDTSQLLGATTIGNRFKQTVTNNSFGFQAGGRYNARRGRWRITCDGALATSYNQQRYFATDISNAANGVQGITETYFNDQSFVPVLDGQFEIAYNISRDIAIRLGAQGIYTWNGIARANTLTTNLNPNSAFGTSTAPQGLIDDGHVAAGFLIGVEWRR